MDSKLIELSDGLLIEVSASEDDANPISSTYVEKVENAFSQIDEVLTTVSNSLASNWHKFNEQTAVEKATIELGVGFEGEGNIFVTKAKANANLTITLELKPKPADKK